LPFGTFPCSNGEDPGLNDEETLLAARADAEGNVIDARYGSCFAMRGKEPLP
jgi:hypothetical protein